MGDRCRFSRAGTLGYRVRGIAGAQPDGFAAPADADTRRGDLSAPQRYVVLTGTAGALAGEDRAAVLGGAAAYIATSARSAWPWRAMEAMALSVPIVAADSGVHRDVIAEGGALVAPEELSDAVTDAVGTGAKRFSVLTGDRARAVLLGEFGRARLVAARGSLIPTP